MANAGRASTPTSDEHRENDDEAQRHAADGDAEREVAALAGAAPGERLESPVGEHEAGAEGGGPYGLADDGRDDDAGHDHEAEDDGAIACLLISLVPPA